MKHSHGARLCLIGVACAVLIGSRLAPSVVSPARAAGHVSAAKVSIIGAGSTFDKPFFDLAFATYAKKNPVSVNYQGIGSGGGIKQFSNNTVDFGATDVPMSDAEVTRAKSNGSAVVQVPVALGGVAVAYNVPGIGADKVLKLDAATLAAIFMGKVTTWNDASIAKLNPAIKLPASSILPVHRSEGSGTTYIFTDYLSAVSADWSGQIGKGKSVSWPVGLGGKGNPGVAAAIKQHPGAIGYVELAYAIDNKIPYAQVKNKANAFVFPSSGNVREAAAQFPKVNYKDFSIVNAPGRMSYPIAGYSWVLLRQHPSKHTQELVALFHWLVTNGQDYATQLNYVALPPNVQQQALQALGSIK